MSSASASNHPDARDANGAHDGTHQLPKPESHRGDEREKLVAQHQKHIKELEEKIAHLEVGSRLSFIIFSFCFFIFDSFFVCVIQ